MSTKKYAITTFISVAFTFGMLSTTSQATPVSYGTASHTTAEWNYLGASENAIDGLTWSINGGDYGNSLIDVGTTGQITIQFKVDLWSAGYGKHESDQVKVWVDWDNSGQWTNNTDNPATTTIESGSEVVIADQYFKTEDQMNDIINGSFVSDDYMRNLPGDARYDTASTTSFESIVYDITSIVSGFTIGDGFWVRARANCTDVVFNNMDPTGSLHQGEVEDYFIGINPVPEPSTMLLFGTGLAGLVGSRIRRKK
jgi:hypothetical protein